MSLYDGIEVAYAGGDGKTYTLILKDELPGSVTKRDDGRDGAGVSWQGEFVAETSEEEGEERRVWFPFGEFRATYRGRVMEHKAAGELRRGGVKRVGVMMRSGFGEQEGEFGVEVRWICARGELPEDGGVKAGL